MRVLMKVAGIVMIVALGVTALPQSVTPSQAGKRAKRYVLIGNNNSLPFNIESLVAATGGRVVKKIGEIGVAVAESADPSFLDAMDNLPGLEAAEDESLFVAPQPSSRLRINQSGTQNLGVQGHNPAKAEFFADQWNMRVIRADEAWDDGFLGDRDVKVAILDTGVDYTLVDFLHNTKIDMELSKSFFEEPLKPLPPGLPSGFEPKDILDFNGHGTHVAGIIAADGILMAGIAPRVTLIIVKVAGRDGFAEWSTIMEAIVYAAKVGADVINMSFGERLRRDRKNTQKLIKGLNSALQVAHESGAILVASAGNEFINWDRNPDEIKLPAMLPFPADRFDFDVVGVSATGPIFGKGFDNLAVFQVGPTEFEPYTDHGLIIVDFAAPGGSFTEEFTDSILSPCSRFIWFREKPRKIVFPCATGGFGLFLEGTSMSAAHVSGTAALVDSVANGALTGVQLFAVLKDTAKDLRPRGQDKFFGFGRIDAFAAVQCVDDQLRRNRGRAGAITGCPNH